jgi:hypothetical protein
VPKVLSPSCRQTPSLVSFSHFFVAYDGPALELIPAAARWPAVRYSSGECDPTEVKPCTFLPLFCPNNFTSAPYEHLLDVPHLSGAAQSSRSLALVLGNMPADTIDASTAGAATSQRRYRRCRITFRAQGSRVQVSGS